MKCSSLFDLMRSGILTESIKTIYNLELTDLELLVSIREL